MDITYPKKNDLKALSRLIKEVIAATPYYSKHAKESERKRFSPKALAKTIRGNNQLYLVAKKRNKIIGFCNGYFDAGLFWIDWLGVEHASREKGVALRLLTNLEKKARKKNVHKLWCDSRINNKESVALLKKASFKKAALLKKHWYKQDFYIWYKFI